MTGCRSWMWQVKAFPCVGLVFSEPGTENTSWLHPIMDLLHPADFHDTENLAVCVDSQISQSAPKSQRLPCVKEAILLRKTFVQDLVILTVSAILFPSLPCKKREGNKQTRTQTFCSKSSLNSVDSLSSDTNASLGLQQWLFESQSVEYI